jgi:hypothetical protein
VNTSQGHGASQCACAAEQVASHSAHESQSIVGQAARQAVARASQLEAQFDEAAAGAGEAPPPDVQLAAKRSTSENGTAPPAGTAALHRAARQA